LKGPFTLGFSQKKRNAVNIEAKLTASRNALLTQIALTVIVTLACVSQHRKESKRKTGSFQAIGALLNFLVVQPTALHLGNLFHFSFLSTAALSQHRFLFQFNKLYLGSGNRDAFLRI
jgi:hypothetical protein